MLLKSLVVAASTAAAFVIVPELSEADENIFKSLPVADLEPYKLPASALSQSIDVPCARCRGKDTQLKLDFTVEDGRTLLVNDFELYPKANPWHGDLVAAVATENRKDKRKRLGYTLSVRPMAKDVDQQMEMIDVVLRVIEVGNRFVDEVPSVKLQLIKATTGEIVIGSLDLMASEPLCHSTWCRTKGILGGLLKGGLHSCGPMHGPKHNPHHGPPHGPPHGYPHEPPHDPHHRPHHGPHHGHRPHDKAHGQYTVESQRYSIRNILKGFAGHILLPVFMGVTAGVSIAFLAMFVGSLVYRVSVFIRGRRQESWCARHESSSTTFADNEKQGLMEDTEFKDDPVQDEEKAIQK